MSTTTKAIGFDLGETLINYPGVPLHWQSLYGNALVEVAKSCGFDLDDNAMQTASGILATYNTRLNPRDEEVVSATVFGEILRAWRLPAEKYLHVAEDAFFDFFQRKGEPYKDVIPTLRHLRVAGYRIGILTDVPYGMDKKFVHRDIAPFVDCIDIVLTSVEVGLRKPRPEGYFQLAKRLQADPAQMTFVGNEPKDIIGANTAGMLSVLVDRDGTAATHGEKRKITSLLELIER